MSTSTAVSRPSLTIFITASRLGLYDHASAVMCTARVSGSCLTTVTSVVPTLPAASVAVTLTAAGAGGNVNVNAPSSPALVVWPPAAPVTPGSVVPARVSEVAPLASGFGGTTVTFGAVASTVNVRWTVPPGTPEPVITSSCLPSGSGVVGFHVTPPAAGAVGTALPSSVIVAP